MDRHNFYVPDISHRPEGCVTGLQPDAKLLDSLTRLAAELDTSVADLMLHGPTSWAAAAR